jgi:hypothetical protein
MVGHIKAIKPAFSDLIETACLLLQQDRKEMIRELSKNDYNFSVLLVLLVVILGITGIAALGALMMFMTAFM